MVFTMASIALMTLDHRQHHLENIRSALSVVIYPVQFLVNLPVMTGEWLSEGLSTRQKLLEENASLRAKNLFLQIKLQKIEALESENMRLRELLDSSFKIGERVLISELLAVDLAPFSQQVVINKGRRHDVYIGQTVLNADGIMGQIVSVGPLTSNAMLITDPSHAIPIEVNRNGLRAIAVGTGEANRLELAHLPNNADVIEGDLLITSGLGGRFPPGYPVGKVTSIIRAPGEAFATVSVEPTGHLESRREVLLVWTGNEDALEDDATITQENSE